MAIGATTFFIEAFYWVTLSIAFGALVLWGCKYALNKDFAVLAADKVSGLASKGDAEAAGADFGASDSLSSDEGVSTKRRIIGVLGFTTAACLAWSAHLKNKNDKERCLAGEA